MKTPNEMNWIHYYESLDEQGYCIIPGVLSTHECAHMQSLYTDAALYRSTITMQRYRFGKGEYKYFQYPLPLSIQSLREMLYTPLARIANVWMRKLSVSADYPLRHHELIAECRSKNQLRPTPLLLRYVKGGYNTLHQDLYGDVYFPFQVVIGLSQPGQDYDGGEFILVENIPRAQSRATAIRLNQGDALIFTTNFRPVAGARGYYRAGVKHGISPLQYGIRYALGIIFHDAL